MSLSKWLLVSLIVIIVTSVIGCGTATPTLAPLPTQPPQVITVIITATPPPPTATVPAPLITPLPTLPLTTVVPGVTPVGKPTEAITQATPKPAVVATKKPTTAPVAAASPIASPLPLKFAAPVLIEPLWTDTQKDERKFPSQALVFKWRALVGMGGDECYLVSVVFSAVNPDGPGPKSDSFLTNCGDQTRADYAVLFTLNQPNHVGPNYASLLIDASQIWVDWSITVVKNLGQCVDQYHCKMAPLSPANKGRFKLVGS